MNLVQLEAWVLAIVDRALAGRPIEDVRVELKRDWPADPAKAARRIAGHANAAGGNAILWVIGVDEKAREIVPLPHTNLADWYPAVRSHFDEFAPSVRDLVVPARGAEVVALLFDTSRFPFVVRNPAAGQPGGGPVEREVPWREGTSIRSAHRGDLVRLLAPLHALPEVDALEGRLHVLPERQSQAALAPATWELFVKLYLTPISPERIVIPFHRCRLTLKVPGLLYERDEDVYLEPPTARRFGGGGPFDEESQVHSLTIGGTKDEIVIDGPGMVWLRSYFLAPLAGAEPTGDPTMRLVLQPIHSLASVTLDLAFTATPPDPKQPGWRWKLTGAVDGS